jgi:hypothetical protein
MNGPMSALAKYFLFTVDDPMIREEFVAEQKATIRGGARDPRSGELSDAIRDFMAGERSDKSITDAVDVKGYFKGRGKYFCVGYLSQFGDIVTATTSTEAPLFDGLSRAVLKLAHGKSYRAARSALFELEYLGDDRFSGRPV